MPDMSLLTHFMVHVSGRMALHPERKLIWQRVIPTLAAEQEYLMHLLLALAGTHALCEADSPDTNLLNSKFDQTIPEAECFRDYHRILDHHQKGLEGLRHALPEATASTAEYIFCGSILIVAFSFASLRIRALGDKGIGFHNGDSAGEPWIDWLHLVRGLGALVGEHYIALRTSRLRTLMDHPQANEHWKDFSATSPTRVFPRLRHASPQFVRFSQGAAQQISLLRDFANTLTQDFGINMEDTPSPDSYGSPNLQTIPELLREQVSTLDRLEEMYMRTLYVFQFSTSERDSSASVDIQTDLEDAAVLSWPLIISNTFILSLQQGQDAGMFGGFSYVILAHFYVILLLFEDLWYLRGAFPREIQNVHRLVEKLGDGALMSLMEWPMAMQGE
ncbi:transcriptional regulator family: Fungal Specific TF [Aspergillus niger]|nr:transcriptional regulator family: Fungal Specific TF [Aspergillus niger]